MQEIILQYYNPGLKIAMGNWSQVYFIPGGSAGAIELTPEYYKGRLVFRIPGCSNRLSYKRIKKDLQSKTTIVQKKIFVMPF